MALTFHIPETQLPQTGPARDARMVVLRDAYAGVAPVPGDRVNVGIVLGPTWFRDLRADGGRAIATRILSQLGVTEPPTILDRVAGVAPLGHSVSSRAGSNWLLAGDAAGFLDPFTGEGLHRAIVSRPWLRKPSTVRSGRPAEHVSRPTRGRCADVSHRRTS